MTTTAPDVNLRQAQNLYLERAMAVIEEYGWARHQSIHPHSGAVCLGGALQLATGTMYRGVDGNGHWRLQAWLPDRDRLDQLNSIYTRVQEVTGHMVTYLNDYKIANQAALFSTVERVIAE